MSSKAIVSVRVTFWGAHRRKLQLGPFGAVQCERSPSGPLEVCAFDVDGTELGVIADAVGVAGFTAWRVVGRKALYDGWTAETWVEQAGEL